MKTIERFEYQLNRETGEKKVITKKYNVRLRLKKWVKITLIILALTTLVIAIKKLDDDFMTTCQNNGYSYDYCMAHK